MLPRELQQISNDRPEYFVQQEEERAQKLKEEQEKFLSELRVTLNKTDEILTRSVAGAAPVEDADVPSDTDAETTETVQPAEPTLEEDQAYLVRLQQFKAELDDVAKNANLAFRQGRITQAQYNEFAKAWQEKSGALFKHTIRFFKA